VLTSPDGKQITPPLNSQTSSATIIDANGNYISNHGDGTFTDTLGKTALTMCLPLVVCTSAQLRQPV
jgi:hypothetical protein